MNHKLDEYNSESRELDEDLTSSGLHEDVTSNGYEVRTLSKSNSRGNSGRSKTDLLSNWRQKTDTLTQRSLVQISNL